MARSKTDPMTPAIFHVKRVILETEDTFTIELIPSNGTTGFSFKPGQFTMLYVLGAGEVPISISGDPFEKRCLTHTIRSVGNVTRLLQKLKAGEGIGVRGPFGSAWPVKASQGRDVIIVAGGIGLAPLRPVLYTVLKNRKKYNRLSLLYGARTPADILYHQELMKWRSQFDIDIHVTVDQAGKSWKGNVGVVTTLISRIAFDSTQAVALICGPEVMMRFTIQEFRQRGLNNEDMYVSMERNMKCGIGFCGHCQYGPYFICKDGPVFRYDLVEDLMKVEEI